MSIRLLILSIAVLPVSLSIAAQSIQAPRFEYAGEQGVTFPGLDPAFLRKENVRCGFLIVREDRAKANSGVLRIAVEIIKARRPQSGMEPVLLIHGGPGGRMIGSYISPMEDSLRKERDVILVDQRGCGLSEPFYHTRMSKSFFELMAQDLSPEQEVIRRRDTAARVRRELASEGIDPAVNNGKEIAADLDDLRKTLGYKAWDIYALSYGTRIALTSMRDFPAGIHKVILDSPLPPNARYFESNTDNFIRSLSLLMKKFEADPDCRKSYPDLESDLKDAINSLVKKPMVIHMDDTVKYPNGLFVVNAQDFLLGLQQALYSRSLYPILPLWIEQTKARNETVMKAFVTNLAGIVDQLSYESYYSVLCNDCMPFNSQSAFVDSSYRYWGGIAFYKAEFEICKVWSNIGPDSVEAKPVVSDIPTLILSGQMDPIAPYGALTQSTLRNGSLVVFNDVGHDVADSRRDTALHLIGKFLNASSFPPGEALVVDNQPIHFLKDIHINKGVFPLAMSLIRLKDNRLLIAVIVFFVFFFLVSMVFCTARLFQKAAMKAPAYLYASFLALSIFGIIFLIGLILTIMHLGSTARMTLIFGFPERSAIILMIPYIVLFFSIIMALSLFRIRKPNVRLKSTWFLYFFPGMCILFVLFCGLSNLLY
jgi:pimeloyl-ACP methyl ester carboxylesterase